MTAALTMLYNAAISAYYLAFLLGLESSLPNHLHQSNCKLKQEQVLCYLHIHGLSSAKVDYNFWLQTKTGQTYTSNCKRENNKSKLFVVPIKKGYSS